MIVGIYKITNLINGKIYIGQSKNCEKRFSEHRTSEHNQHLLRAYEKYGFENFSFEIIEEARESELDDLEEKYIKEYDSMNPSIGYNKRSGGGRPRFSEETAEKIKKNRWTSEQRALVSARQRDPLLDAERRKAISDHYQNLSEEEKQKRKDQLNMHVGKKRSEETKNRMSESQKKVDRSAKKSEESNLKRSEKMKELWARRKELKN